MLEEAVRYVTASSLFMSAGFVLSAIDVSAFGESTSVPMQSGR